ncbi:MAG: bacillithiol system redox-active protein YtxJ [Saprospiraceae bacterium]
MGFLKNFSSSQNTDLNKDWKTLDSLTQLEQIIDDSHQKPVAIFKHSTRCGISTMAKSQLEDGWNISSDDLDFYYLDLLAHRPISNEIADQLDVMHQSPQVILIKNGKAVFSNTHHSISADALQNALAKV